MAVSALEIAAAQAVVARALAAGVEVPVELAAIGHGCGEQTGARLWAEANPEAESAGCCFGDIQRGPAGCLCWEPVYDVPVVLPVTVIAPEQAQARSRPCGDCAYRAGSPERAEPWLAEELMNLPERGQRFWCHQGMARPVRWRHPDGRRVPGASDDWQPLIIAGVPYRAFGQPGLLCAGWAARTGR